MKGKILKIDLSDQSYVIEEIPDKVIEHYLGGRGLGSHLLYKLVPPKADPLGEKNHLIFTAGPANGTNLPFASKHNLNTKSPLTNIYLYTICSGTFGHEMRKAGFWALDIKGVADTPTYIAINNQRVWFKDASSLWGMETAKTQETMLREVEAKKAATMAIGPGGEKLIKCAAIFSEGSRYRCFGRGGAGCVMGAKKLKGIVVSGDKQIDIPDRDRFDAARKAIIEKIKMNQKWAEAWRRYGTGDLQLMQETGILPTRNWTGGQFNGWSKISRPTAIMGWPEKSIDCGPFCPVPCSHYVEIADGPYQGAHCDGPEYETVYAFGSQCGIDRMDAIVAAMQICDESGIDSMTAGVSIGFAMECFERGLINLKETDGIELRFGNHQALIQMLKKIANQEGFGKRLGEGVKNLSERIKGSESFAMHVKGLEFGGYECRGLNGQALAFSISNRGACHHAYGLPARVELTQGTHLNIEGKGEQVKNIAIDAMIRDSVLNCAFGRPAVDLGIMAEVLTALSGELWSTNRLTEVGLRIMCQERLFNAREGITRKDDSLPTRLLNEPKPDGPSKGAVVPLEELKDSYYRAMGWDPTTGNPTDSILEKFEIEK
jgi:aldehyde:ferredoxin oxidoreductase